jgi:hypothetical protein
MLGSEVQPLEKGWFNLLLQMYDACDLLVSKNIRLWIIFSKAVINLQVLPIKCIESCIPGNGRGEGASQVTHHAF